MAGPTQPDLFDGPPVGISLIRPAVLGREVVRIAQRVPKNPHFGTSSWSFPGWVGIVYDPLYSVSQLARHGLSAYARHPLLTAVNLDSPFYKVPSPEQIAAYAAAVPGHFRFLVKAHAGLTVAPESFPTRDFLADRSVTMALRRGVEPVFLDASFAARTVVKPLVEGLGARLGVILFQFSPLGALFTRTPKSFVTGLGEFLSALPAGPTYAVELHDPELLGSEYDATCRR